MYRDMAAQSLPLIVLVPLAGAPWALSRLTWFTRACDAEFDERREPPPRQSQLDA